MTTVLDQLLAARTGAPLPASEVEARQPVVGSYQRISDAYEGGSTGITTDGVERQAQACEHIAQARGWTIGRTYVDNNVSAFKDNVRRDAFEAMLDDLQAGVIQGVVCYNLDRFARQVGDLERAISIYDRAKRAGLPLYFATAEGDLNLASDDGLTLARVMVAFANKSSRDSARRVAAKHRATRDTGRQVSGSRPFGWDVEDGRRVLNDAEAEAIRWAATGLTAGTLTWRDVLREWNDRGLLTPNGGQWKPQTTKQVMRSPRLAGWLVHNGNIALHSQTGELVRGIAPAILSDEGFEALLRATQSDSGNYTSASGRRKYLMSGIARCRECGGRMVGNAQPAGRFVYKCASATCSKVTCSGEGLDRHVTALVLPRVIRESKRLRLMDVPPHGAELTELEGERSDLIAAHASGELSAELVFPRVSKIDARLEVLRQARSLHSLAQRQLHGTAMTAKVWEALDDDERRVHVARHVEAVYLSPRIRNTGRKFDTERVSEPVWRSANAPVERTTAP